MVYTLDVCSTVVSEKYALDRGSRSARLICPLVPLVYTHVESPVSVRCETRNSAPASAVPSVASSLLSVSAAVLSVLVTVWDAWSTTVV